MDEEEHPSTTALDRSLELEPLVVPTSIFYQQDQQHLTQRHTETHEHENTPFFVSSNQHHEDEDDDPAHAAFHQHRRALSSDFVLLREKHVSLEQLNPHPSCQSRRSCDRIATINLVATVCGGGYV